MMKRIAAPLIFLLLLAALAGCAARGETEEPDMNEPDDKSAVYHSLTPEEAKARMDSSDAVLVRDVRRADEYAEGHIPGAALLPNEEIGTEMPESLPDLDAEILVYCRSGRRSREAANKLVAMGYTAVYDFGGIQSWPYEVTAE